MPDTNSPPGFGQLIAEMRRRHVVRFAFAYAAAAFVVLQLAEIIFPAFGIGEGGLRVLVVGTTLGFPPSLVIAWIYDLTRDGVRRTEASDATPVLRRLAIGALVVTSLGSTGFLGWYLADQGVFDRGTTIPEGVLRDGAAAPALLVAYDPEAPIRSLAVLPLDDYSPDADQAYFAASMHEELIAKLSLLDEIRVVSRTSVMRYAQTTVPMPEIGRALSVDVVIEGSVTRSDDRTRVTLQIIHAASDSHIQTLQWDSAGVSDVLGFQSLIAHDVVHEIIRQYDETAFSRAVAQVDPEAQDAYFRGRYEYDQGTPEGYRAAMDLFEDALEAEPDFAPALAGLAGARFLIELDKPEVSQDELAQALREAVAAIEIDSESVEAREVLVLIERSIPEVLGVDPLLPAPDGSKQIRVVHMPDGMDSLEIDVAAFDTAWVAAVTSLGEQIETRVRRWSDDADRASESRSSEGSQRNDADRTANRAAVRSAYQARQYLGSGHYAQAHDLLEEVVKQAPEYGPGWDMLVRTLVASGDIAAATRTVESWRLSGAPGAPTEFQVEDLVREVEAGGERGYWAWTLNRLEAREAEGRRPPKMEFANAHAALGHADEAFRYAVEALERGEPGVFGIRSDPAWDGLREDPRYAEIGRQARAMRFSPRRRPRGGGR
jgi:TolB-like protein